MKCTVTPHVSSTKIEIIIVIIVIIFVTYTFNIIVQFRGYVECNTIITKLRVKEYERTVSQI